MLKGSLGFVLASRNEQAVGECHPLNIGYCTSLSIHRTRSLKQGQKRMNIFCCPAVIASSSVALSGLLSFLCSTILCVQREIFGATFELNAADAADVPTDAVIPGIVSCILVQTFWHQSVQLNGMELAKTGCLQAMLAKLF